MIKHFWGKQTNRKVSNIKTHNLASLSNTKHSEPLFWHRFNFFPFFGIEQEFRVISQLAGKISNVQNTFLFINAAKNYHRNYLLIKCCFFELFSSTVLIAGFSLFWLLHVIVQKFWSECVFSSPKHVLHTNAGWHQLPNYIEQNFLPGDSTW